MGRLGTAGVMLSHLIPRPLFQTTSIFFLAISPLISRSAALTAALMRLVHKKYLAQ